MARRILLLAAGLAAACGGVVRSVSGGSGGDALSFAQYHALEKGMSAKAIVDAFGPPADIVRRDDRVRGLAYRCEGADGEAGELRLFFSAKERLEKWVLKPPPGKAPAATENTG